jgi:hypothetical protein
MNIYISITTNEKKGKRKRKKKPTPALLPAIQLMLLRVQEQDMLRRLVTKDPWPVGSLVIHVTDTTISARIWSSCCILFLSMPRICGLWSKNKNKMVF